MLEVRHLYASQSRTAQGSFNCWIENCHFCFVDFHRDVASLISCVISFGMNEANDSKSRSFGIASPGATETSTKSSAHCHFEGVECLRFDFSRPSGESHKPVGVHIISTAACFAACQVCSHSSNARKQSSLFTEDQLYKWNVGQDSNRLLKCIKAMRATIGTYGNKPQ